VLVKSRGIIKLNLDSLDFLIPIDYILCMNSQEKYIFGLRENRQSIIEECPGCNGEMEVWYDAKGNTLASECLNQNCGQVQT
jgi:hypothetical protein